MPADQTTSKSGPLMLDGSNSSITEVTTSKTRKVKYLMFMELLIQKTEMLLYGRDTMV